MRTLTWILLFGGIATAYMIYTMYSVPTADEETFDEPTYFGYGEPQPDVDVAIREFKINVSGESLEDLKGRLRNTRWGEGFAEDFSYGTRVDYMKEIAEYWMKSYDWKKHEDILNSFPQFKTRIEGVDVYFIRVKPTAAKVVHPILIIHGWPGSVWEFYKLIPLLTQGSDVAFEVICPSIPGYGFSEAPHKAGFSALSAARIFHKLMQRLGHKNFYLQGGDWGSVVATLLSQQYPQNVRGLHLNMMTYQMGNTKGFLHLVGASFYPSLFLKEGEQLTPIGDIFKILLKEGGYFHIQATKPDTIGTGLNDSPAGLAAYILEKFSYGTNQNYVNLRDGGLTKHFTLDELLTNVMMYWITESIGSSMRFYKEYHHSALLWSLDKDPVTVPTGLAQFPHETLVPKTLASYKFWNIVQYTRMPSGGHFAALQEPNLLADDIKSFVKKVEETIN